MFKNWKTTLAGVIVFVATLGGPVLGLSANVTRVAEGIAIALGLVVAKDHNVTGGS